MFPSAFSEQVICSCCNKRCLMLWSQLPWKLTGTPLCSTYPGENEHKCSFSSCHQLFTQLVILIYTNIYFSSLCVCAFVCFSVLLSQYGWGNWNSILRDPFRPHKVSEVCRYREKNWQVSKKSPTASMLSCYYIQNQIETGVKKPL